MQFALGNTNSMGLILKSGYRYATHDAVRMKSSVFHSSIIVLAA